MVQGTPDEWMEAILACPLWFLVRRCSRRKGEEMVNVDATLHVRLAPLCTPPPHALMICLCPCLERLWQSVHHSVFGTKYRDDQFLVPALGPDQGIDALVRARVCFGGALAPDPGYFDGKQLCLGAHGHLLSVYLQSSILEDTQLRYH